MPDNYLTEITRLLDDLDARPRPSHSPRGLTNRGVLGDFLSILCFQEAVRGLEDVLGLEAASVVLIRAGRLRGQTLVDAWGVGHLELSIQKVALLLDAALGHDGTRLCAVRGATDDGQEIRIRIQEPICAAPSCTYTLGAVWGALETLTGEQYTGEQLLTVEGEPSGNIFIFRRLHSTSALVKPFKSQTV